MDIPVVTGEKLHVIIRGKGPGKQRIMVSQVLEDSRNGVLTIAMPIQRGRLVPIKQEKEVGIMFYRDNGVYEFEARVIGRSGGRIPSLKIQVLSPIKKSQRRDYYRLNTVLPVQVHISYSEEDCIVVKCLTLDFSAGGMRLASDRNIEKDCIVTCYLVLSGKPLTVKAKVIRNTTVYSKEYAYEIGVQFVELNEKVRSGIIGFIFEEQRKLKRKGLI